MIRPDQGKYSITQQFNDSCCRQMYAQFGMLGHNGLDIGCPDGSQLYAPITGSVRTGSDPRGYGNYVFVSNGSVEVVVAHMKRVDIPNGSNAVIGQPIGLSGNSGFSTAPHCHFGTRPIPYNSSNGFAGYVDPNIYLKGEDTMTEGQVNLAFAIGFNRQATAQERQQFTGKEVGFVLQTVFNNNDGFRAKASQYDDLKKQYEAGNVIPKAEAKRIADELNKLVGGVV